MSPMRPVHEEKSTSRIWSNLAYTVDDGIGSRARIGMVVLSSDQTLSHEARAMLNVPGVALHESRLLDLDEPSQALTTDILDRTFDGVDEAIRQINSRRASDVIALGCTSAAMVIGPPELQRRVHEVQPEAQVTDPFTAILAALRALGSNRVGFVSPYPRDVAEEMIMGIEGAGIRVPTVGTFQKETGSFIGDAPFIMPMSISDSVSQMANSVDVDTVVVACTQMRAAALIADLERQTNKAVISSNQALCWHSLRLAGVGDAIPGWGRLFETVL